MLSTVTKMITIGLRAKETEFLTKLQLSRTIPVPGIRREVELLVVTGSKEGAEQTFNNLAPYGVSLGPFPNPITDQSRGGADRGYSFEGVRTTRDGICTHQPVVVRVQLTVYGEGTYDDIFSCTHWITFCSYLTRDTKAWAVCQLHNDTGDMDTRTCKE